MEFHYILILQGNAGEDVTNCCFLGSDHRWTHISFCSFGWTPDGLCWIVGLCMAITFVCSRFTTPDHLVVHLTTITVMRGKYVQICANSFDWIVTKHTHAHTHRCDEHTHLSPVHSREKTPHCTGCGGPGEGRRGLSHRMNLHRESYRDFLSPVHRDQWRRGWKEGRSRGCRARGTRKGTGRACRGERTG